MDRARYNIIPIRGKSVRLVTIRFVDDIGAVWVFTMLVQIQLKMSAVIEGLKFQTDGCAIAFRWIELRF